MHEVQIILKKVATGEETPVTDKMVAGRLDTSGLVLTEGHPSRRHAVFSVSGVESQLEDLGSSNGTYVNDQRISGAVILRSGDKVRFDVEEYEYLVVGEPTVVEGNDKTVLRKPEDIDVDGSELRQKPAWIDADKQAEGGPKTEFIDAAAMKEMVQVDAERTAADSAESVDVPMLLVTSGERSGHRFTLTSNKSRGEWTIGGDDDRDIKIADQGMSGIHAKLTQDGKRWKLTDQMSANGTFVNGRRSNMSYLNNGDRIRFGPVDCVFHTPDSFGTATRISPSGKHGMSTRNIIIGIVAFAATMAVVLALFRFF